MSTLQFPNDKLDAASVYDANLGKAQDEINQDVDNIKRTLDNQDYDDLKNAIGIVGTFNIAHTTSGTGVEIGKFYPIYGHKYLMDFYSLAANRVFLYEFDTNGDYTTYSNEVTIGRSTYEKAYSPTSQNVSYVRLYAASPSGSAKGGDCVVFDLSAQGMANKINALDNNVGTLETGTGVVGKYYANIKSEGVGVEIGKLYPESGKKYELKVYNLVADRLVGYEYDTNGNYTTYVDIAASGKSELSFEYSPTINNVDYLRIYAAAPSGSNKGGDCIAYQISDSNEAKAINELTKAAAVTDRYSIVQISLENGGISNTGEKNNNANTVRFADKIGITSGVEYKISIETAKKITVCYCSTFDSGGDLIARIVVDNEDRFTDNIENKTGFFITPGSTVAYILPYFYSGTESLAANDVSKPAISYPTKKDIKILACGDSICHGVRNNYFGFAGGLGFRFKNIGVGNSSIATNTGTGVENIPNTLAAENSYSPDVIISDGGVNDYHYDSPLGTVPDAPITTDEEAAALDRTTVVGGACYLFYQMIKKFPDARRFFLITHKTLWNTGSTPVYCPATENGEGYTQQELHDALVAVCNLYGVTVIDVFKDGMINTKFSQYRSPVAWSTDESTANEYMVDADGVHPMAKGYLYGYAPLIRLALSEQMV